MPLTPEELAKMDADAGVGSSLTPDMLAQMDADAGIVTPQPADKNSISQAYDERIGNLQSIAEKTVDGEMHPASAVLQQGWQGLGLGADVAGIALGTAVKGAKNYLTLTDPRAYAALSKTGKDISQSKPAKLVGQAVEKVSGLYGSAKEENPELVGNIEAGLGIASSVLPSARAFKSVGKGVSRGAKTLAEDPFGSLDNVLTPKEKPLTATQNRASGSDWYEEVKRLGEKIPPENAMALSDKLARLRPTDAGEAAVWDKSGVQKHADIINEIVKSDGLTFPGASALRSDLNSELKVAYRAGDATKALHLERLKDALTGAMDANSKSSNAWKMANHEWAKQGILGDLELIAAKASGKAQPANSLDTAINNFLNNPNKSAGLRPDERAALAAVTKRSQTGELLKSAGTRLMPTIGAAVGGVPGFLVGHYGSMLSRTTAEAVKLKKLDRVYEMINNRKPPVEDLYQTSKAKFDASKGKK